MCAQCEKEVVDKVELVEWFSTNYQKFGCKLEFVTNKSQVGGRACGRSAVISIHLYIYTMYII